MLKVSGFSFVFSPLEPSLSLSLSDSNKPLSNSYQHASEGVGTATVVGKKRGRR
jgi:hypothetical protein